jgi:hypothetical protein
MAPGPDPPEGVLIVRTFMVGDVLAAYVTTRVDVTGDEAESPRRAVRGRPAIEREVAEFLEQYLWRVRGTS